MKLNLDDLLTIFDLKEKNYSQIEKILFEYGSLTKKLQNVEAQSFYFKKGLKNNKLRKLKLKKKWEIIRSDINTASVDELISSLNDNNNTFAFLKEKRGLRTNDFLALASAKSNVAYIKELISVKGRVKEIFDIDYYFKNKDELKILLGI